MNEDFAPFELAVKLNEKGFNEPCYGYYHCNGGNDSFELCGNGDRDFLNSKNQYRVAAPTISQVLKWLREEKGLHIEIYMYHNCYLWEIYNTKIYDADFTQKSEKYSEIEYETYEQAALAGVNYCLDNLI